MIGVGLLERRNSKRSDTEGSLLFLGCLREALNKKANVKLFDLIHNSESF